MNSGPLDPLSPVHCVVGISPVYGIVDEIRFKDEEIVDDEEVYDLKSRRTSFEFPMVLLNNPPIIATPLNHPYNHRVALSKLPEDPSDEIVASSKLPEDLCNEIVVSAKLLDVPCNDIVVSSNFPDRPCNEIVPLNRSNRPCNEAVPSNPWDRPCNDIVESAVNETKSRDPKVGKDSASSSLFTRESVGRIFPSCLRPPSVDSPKHPKWRANQFSSTGAQKNNNKKPGIKFFPDKYKQKKGSDAASERVGMPRNSERLETAGNSITKTRTFASLLRSASYNDAAVSATMPACPSPRSRISDHRLSYDSCATPWNNIKDSIWFGKSSSKKANRFKGSPARPSFSQAASTSASASASSGNKFKLFNFPWLNSKRGSKGERESY